MASAIVTTLLVSLIASPLPVASQPARTMTVFVTAGRLLDLGEVTDAERQEYEGAIKAAQVARRDDKGLASTRAHVVLASRDEADLVVEVEGRRWKGSWSARAGSFGSSQAIPQGRRDSLWNGTLIGAGLGGLLGALGGSAVLECSECSGFNVPLTFGVLGAGAGAAIGAGIDAARHDRASAWTSPRPRRLVVAPVLREHTRALVGFVQF